MHFPTLLLALFSPSLAAGAIVKRQPETGSTGKWLVKLRPEADQAQHLRWVGDVHRRSLSRRQTAGVERQYHIGAYRAYLGDFDDATVDELAASEDVVAIEPDYVALTTAATSNATLVTDEGQPWGLRSISSRTPLGADDDLENQTYIYDASAGTGTFAYVLDTGVVVGLDGFGGRAVRGLDVWGDEYDFEECANHGTHVAGTIGSAPYGVAKNASIVSVKVLHSCGLGSVDNALQGLEWVVQNVTATPGKAGRSVVSMSIAFWPSEILNDAIQAVYEAGIFVVVGAGNDGFDAWIRSPASAPYAFTVGAIDAYNTRPAWSNYGPLVDVFAPGVSVRSLFPAPWNNGLLDGTSMATPHVTGLALYLKGLEGAALDAPAAVAARILELATKDAINDPGEGSPNLIAYNGNGLR